MRLVIALLTTMALAAGAAAAPLISITPLAGPPSAKSYQGAEPFESTMPPAGWYLDSTNPAATWTLTIGTPYEGLSHATCPVDPAGGTVDERLGFMHSYVATEILHFALRGTVADDVTLEVWVGEDLVFDFDRDWTLPPGVWGLVEVELGTTGSVGLPNVDFAWHYVGVGAPAIDLDMVWIDETPIGEQPRSWGGVKDMFR